LSKGFTHISLDTIFDTDLGKMFMRLGINVTNVSSARVTSTPITLRDGYVPSLGKRSNPMWCVVRSGVRND